MQDNIPKISFCSTCMNRGSQLRTTLEKNLATIAEFNGLAELILVNFIKDEEGQSIHDWIVSLGAHDNFHYFFTTALPVWHASIAKNTSHLQANSAYLINLDCDNFLEASTIEAIITANNGELSNVIFSGFTGGFKKTKPNNLGRILRNAAHALLGRRKPAYLGTVRRPNGEDQNGTYGHIGLSKQCFVAIGGYNQSLPPMGGQDRDLLLRAYSHLENPVLLHIPSKILPVQNDKLASLAHTPNPDHNWELMDAHTKKITKKAIQSNQLFANKHIPIGVPATHYIHNENLMKANRI